MRKEQKQMKLTKFLYDYLRRVETEVYQVSICLFS